MYFPRIRRGERNEREASAMTREAKSSGEEGIQRVGGKATDARKREREMDAIEMGSIAKHLYVGSRPRYLARTEISWVRP